MFIEKEKINDSFVSVGEWTCDGYTQKAVKKEYTGKFSWWNTEDDLCKREKEVLNLCYDHYILAPLVLFEGDNYLILEWIDGCNANLYQNQRKLLPRIATILRKIHSIRNTHIAVYSPQFSDAKISLLHGDFHNQNIMVSPENGEIRGIIDFEEACYGNRHLDIAHYCQYLIDQPFKDSSEKKEILLEFLDAYEDYTIDDLQTASRILEQRNEYLNTSHFTTTFTFMNYLIS